MKSLPLLFFVCSVFATSAANPATPPELARLQHKFEQRRAKALRPVDAWYRRQLDALQQEQADAPPETVAAIAAAVAAAREAFWQDDQPELRSALLGTSWLWRSEDDAEGVAASFRADGSVKHIGMSGVWRVTGPREVTIQTDAHEQFILHFNASLTAYEADRRQVSGERLAALK